METSQFEPGVDRFQRLRKLGCVCAFVCLTSCSPSENPASLEDQKEGKSALAETSSAPAEEKVTITKGRGPRVKTKDGTFVRNATPTLNKNHTILMLGSEPDVRAATLYGFARDLLTPEQVAEAERISASYDAEYLRLLRERSQILEYATDGSDVDERVAKIYQETIELNRKIRTEIRLQVLTVEQQNALKAMNKDKQKSKKEVASGS